MPGVCDPCGVRNLIAFATVAGLLVPACKASVNVNANAQATAKAEPTQEEPEWGAAPTAETTADDQPQQTDYFGIARGLTLAPGRQAACSCIAAAVGMPSDPAFKWRGLPPKVASDGMVMAISTEGIACDTQGPGPSIRGVDRSGEDVVVVIEDYHAGRPQALGAIIPNPGGNGAVYVRAAGKTAYGKPLAATNGAHPNWCLVSKGSGAANTVVAPRDPADSSGTNPK